jgi:hypothetical protein
MRRRVPGCGVVVCAAALAAASIVARAATVVPWQAAGSYDGETVTVEGDVVRARLEADTCVLEFSLDDPNAFRAILLIPLITDLPRQPQRLYENKRVRVSGTIRSWQGQPEMIVRSPDAIQVVGVSASALPETTSTTTPAPASRRRLPPTTLPPPPPPPPPPPAAPAPSAVPSAPPPPAATATVPAPLVPTTTMPSPAPRALPVPPPPTTSTTTPEQEEQAPRLPRAIDPCVSARERWRRAAAAAESRAAELTQCLRAGNYHCRATASAMAPALSELEWAEQQVEAACP